MTSKWLNAALAVTACVLLATEPILATQVAAGCMILFAVSFVSVYLRSAWHSTAPGRSVMFLMIVAGVFGVYMLYITINNVYPVNVYLRGALYIITAAAVINLFQVLLRERRVEDHAIATLDAAVAAIETKKLHSERVLPPKASNDGPVSFIKEEPAES